MDTSVVIERVEQVAATCASPDAAHADIAAALSAITQVESHLAGRRAELVSMLSALPGALPEADIAHTTRCSLGRASKETARADTLDAADAFADALLDGDITTGHVDALTRAGRQLDEPQRAALFDRHEQLANEAAGRTIAEFDTLLRRTVRELQADDGSKRLERQRRSTRLRTWVDHDDMWNIAGRFDPKTGIDLARQLRTTTEAMFAETAPDTAPDDPIERSQHLQALALARLMLETRADSPAASNGAEPELATVPTTRSRVDAVVVVDATQTDGAGGPIVDWGIPVELPHHALVDLLGLRQPDVVVVANGLVLHAPGELNLGRTTRLANRAQRRALRGLYTTCAIPGCTVHYDRCKLHHIIWWRHGGRTDLDNLLPVCTHHHTNIHNNSWDVSLGANRELTIHIPDGRTIHTGPPKRSAA
ncbi:MAG: HNH endonuclease signature motif containing protein [Actinomycetota bacterium]